MNPITMKLAPNDVIPPIFRVNACIIKVTKDTIVLEKGPNNIAINGIMKKWIGTPSGDGIDNDVMPIVKTLNKAIDIILFLYFHH